MLKFSTDTYIIELFAMVAAIALPSCNDELEPVHADSNCIRFAVDLSSEVKSRGDDSATHYSAISDDAQQLFAFASEEPITANTNESYSRNDSEQSSSSVVEADNKVYVHAYMYAGSGEWADNFGMSELYISSEVSRSGSTSEWSTSTEYFWPGSDYSMKFFAHAPINSGTINISKHWPHIIYNCLEQNNDLIIASETVNADNDEAYDDFLPGDYHKCVNLHFYHALTSVKITLSDDLESRVASVAIENVHCAGKHEFGGDEWTYYSPEGEKYALESVEMNVGEPHMMIPQTLDSTAKIVVTFTDGSTKELSLANARWRMGRSVVYRISDDKTFTEWICDLPDDLTVSWMGGNITEELRSYVRMLYENESGEIVEKIDAAPWSATVLGNNHTWLHLSAATGVGNADAYEPLQFSMDSSPYTYSNPRNERLKQAQPVSGVYDLSTDGGTTARTTANCYLVNAPGTYQLPLVFGNAIVDGETNTIAYKPSTVNGSGSKLSEFKDFRRGSISTPYIYNQTGNVPYDAILCWQDAPDLLTDVTLDADKQNLQFTVQQSTIQQGNALVAVRNASKVILWSWHIWVTDYVLGSELSSVSNNGVPDNPNATATTSDFMPFNIGMCDEGTYSYDERSATIAVTQSYCGETRTHTFEVTQREHVFHPITNTYYQWGRKDPMLPGYMVEDGSSYDPITEYYQLVVTNKEQYYSDEAYKYTSLPTSQAWDGTQSKYVTADLATAIQNPMVFFTGSSNWCNWFPVNLWNASNSGDVHKTVYDPSPKGFCIPSAKVFTGFTNDGTNVRVSLLDEGTVEDAFNNRINTYIRSKDDFVRNFGFTFYCRVMPSEGAYNSTGGTTHFPVIGYRPGDGSSSTPLEAGKLSYTWSCNPDASKSSAWYMVFGISEEYLDLIPRTLGGTDNTLPVNLANGFSVRPIREY